MKTIITALTAASILFAAQGSALASDYGKPVRPIGPFKITTQKSTKHDLGKFAIGFAIGAGLVGAAIAAERARPVQRGYLTVGYGDDRSMCRIWRADCRDGSDRACYKYERNC